MVNQRSVGARSSQGTRAGGAVGSRTRERGQSLVEMALVLPFFFLVIMATVDFGFALQRYITLTNAAREGARYGAVTPEITAQKIVDETEKRLNTSPKIDASVSATCLDTNGVEDWGCERGSEVTVEVEHVYGFITPLGPLLNFVSFGSFPSEVTLSSQTTMRRE